MRAPCDDCRRKYCQKRGEVMSMAFFAMADFKTVECDDQLLTWEAQLAA